jgi:hypothetical protein
MHSLLDDPWIRAQVDAAVAPYEGRLPAADLAWMREQLAETLAADPRAAGLLRRAHPRAVDESGEVVGPGEGEGGAAAPAAPLEGARRRGAR